MIFHPMENDMNENMKNMKTLILERFSNDVEQFYSWSHKHYEEVNVICELKVN